MGNDRAEQKINCQNPTQYQLTKPQSTSAKSTNQGWTLGRVIKQKSPVGKVMGPPSTIQQI